MLWYILLVVLSLYLYLKLIKPQSYWKIRNVPDKKGWPLLGNMSPALFGRQPFTEFINDLYKECKGRYLGAYQFVTPMLIVKDLEIIKRVTIKDFEHFTNHKGFASEKADPLFGNNLFQLSGKKWRDIRSTFSPAFTGSKMRLMYSLMSECAQNYINHLEQKSKSSKILEIQISDIFSRFVNDAVATCAFGIEINSLKDRNNDFYVIGSSLTFDGIRGLLMFGFTLSPRLMEFLNLKYISERVNNFYRGIVRDTMKKREEEGIYRPDMINLLMEAKKGKLKYEESQHDDDIGFATVEESDFMKQSTNKEELSLDVLTSQALIFFLAGFDGVVEGMKILSYELAVNPDVQDKLQFEIDEVFLKHEKITYDVIKQMKYLDMVVSELLRKWPLAIMIDRVCTKEYTIKAVDPGEEDLNLEVGQVLWIPIYGIHHDPEYYPNPERFDPERFSDENRANINPFAYIPFGAGPRNCVGNRFALMEIKSLFVYLLKHFSISVTKKTQLPLTLSRSTFGLHIPNIYLGLTPR